MEEKDDIKTPLVDVDKPPQKAQFSRTRTMGVKKDKKTLF